MRDSKGRSAVLDPKRIGIVIFSLLILLMPVSLLHAAFSQKRDEQLYRTKALLGIVEAVNATVKETFDTLEARDIPVPAKARSLYHGGLLLAEGATNLMDEGNYSEASSRAVEALQMFREALRLTSGYLPTKPTEAEVIADRIIRLKTEINRTYEYARRLEDLADKVPIVATLNLSDFENSIADARTHLERALKKLGELKVEEAAADLSAAMSLLNESLRFQNTLANDVKAMKTERFLAEARKRLSMVKANITAVSETMPELEKNASLTALSRAEHSLESATDLMEKSMIDETIGELVKFAVNLDESLSYLEAAKAELDEKD